MRCGLVTALLLTACASPPPDCQRRGVPGQQLFGDFRFEDSDVTVRVAGPLTGCPGDQLAARVEVRDATNALVPADVDAPILERTSFAQANARVTTTVRFRSRGPGTYLVSVTFEPTLGTRNVTVSVLERYVARGGVVTPSQRCAQPPSPLSGDTLACELGNSLVGVFSDDGGSATFDGTRLVTAGRVLWSVRTGGFLERHEWTDGGLRLTHQWSDVREDAFAAEHTQLTAIRVDTTGRVTAFLPDGGRSTYGLVGPEVAFLEGEQVEVRQRSEFVGLEPTVLWLSEHSGAPVFEVTRPCCTFTTTAVAPQVRRVVPTEGFVWWPLWVDLDDGRSVLLSRSGAFSEWPTARVLRVGTEHVVLSEDADAGSYRITPLPQ